MFRYVLAWIPMLVIAIANGAFRQLTFAKVMSEPHAHQLSTLTGSVCIGAFIWFVVRKWPPSSSRQALLIGLVWVLHTVTFETFMGLVLQHRPMQDVLYEYNLFAGRVWPLFLVWLGVAPWTFFRLGRTQKEIIRDSLIIAQSAARSDLSLVGAPAQLFIEPVEKVGEQQ